MSINDLMSGYMLFADGTLVRIYKTQEEADRHVKFQRETMQSKALWKSVPIKVDFKGHKRYE